MPPAQILRAYRGRAFLSPAAHVLCALAAALLVQSAPGSAQKVRITNLSDVDFGTITNLQADSRRAQNICLYSNGATGGYSVLASGSGAGSAFSLANGPSLMAYDVEWSGQSGQSSGTALSPNVALTGQTSSATHQFCNSGPSASASLVVVLRGSELSRAPQGNYSGTLTLLIAAE
jgi:hypothetical protein